MSTYPLFSGNYPLLDAFWTMLWFFLWILWIFLLVRILIDVFRSGDLSGWGKAGWTILIIILPFLGVLLYLIFRGGTMQERDIQQARANEAAFRSYVQDAAGGTTSTAEEVAKLGELRDRGLLTDEEFASQKAKLLS